MDQINSFLGGGASKDEPKVEEKKPESAMPTMEGVKEKVDFAIQKSHETAVAAKDKVFAATTTEPKPKENEGGLAGAAGAVKGAFGFK